MGDRLSRRQVFASIALAQEIPLPTKVRWVEGGELWLSFDGPGAVEAVRAWGRFFNAPTDKKPTVFEGERSLVYDATGWGWEIVLLGTEPAEELGDGVRELLEHIMEVAGDDTD